LSPSVVLGVTGSIAAYKACEIIRGLRKRGCKVTVVMSRGAREFVTPVTFQALSGRKVITDLFDLTQSDIEHVTLSRECSLLLVAPATANILGKLAHGIADDFLTSFALASRAPLMIAPAMNPRMWSHPAVQKNVSSLSERGCTFVGPEEGPMAEDESGVGRLADPQIVVDRALEMLGSGNTLSGRKLLITAGPTRELIDAVRFLSNPSSGKMGYALAEAAVRRGAEVTLVSGPTSLPEPEGVQLIRVESANQMRNAVIEVLPGCDVVIKAAAVSDFTAADPQERKVKKGEASLSLELVRTPDILEEIAGLKGKRFLVGFAAETDDLVANARKKLQSKGLDLIVANDVSGGAIFGADESQVVIIDRAGGEEHFGPATKFEIADHLLDLIQNKVAA
jgi:phosphopantothenoylcysteine decarboxylase/phosphopantothenate--cysteine ligase